MPDDAVSMHNHPGLSDTILLSISRSGFTTKVLRQVPYDDDTLTFELKSYRCPLCNEVVPYEYMWTSEQHGGGLGGEHPSDRSLGEYVKNVIELLDSEKPSKRVVQ